MIGDRPILITGGAGFVGANLADALAADGHDVLVLDSLARNGVAENLEWLSALHPARVMATIADVRDAGAVRNAVAQAGAVFHLAAQVAVTTSVADPVADFEVNARGTLNVLEAALAQAEPPPVVFASTNKVTSPGSSPTRARWRRRPAGAPASAGARASATCPAGWTRRARRAPPSGPSREGRSGQPALELCRQHLFRLPRAAFAAGARLFAGAAGARRARCAHLRRRARRA